MYAAAVEQNTLYYISNNIHKLSAVDLQSGQIRWQTPLSRNAVTGPIHLMNGVISMTITSYETEKATNSFVSAFDAATGKSLWQSAPIHYPILDCTVTQNAIYFGAPRSAVYALDVHTGRQLWQSPNIDFAGVAPQADGSLVYATVHEWEPPMFPWTGTQIVAIHVGNGSIAWHYTGRSQNINSMIVHLGVLYVSYGQAGLDVLNAQRSIIWHLPQGATYNSGANGLEAIP